MNYSVSALRKLVAEMCWMVTSCNVSFKILNIVQPVVHMLRPVRRRDIRPHSEQTGWATIPWEKPRAGCRNFEWPLGSRVSTSTGQPEHWNRVNSYGVFKTGWLNKSGPKIDLFFIRPIIWILILGSCSATYGSRNLIGWYSITWLRGVHLLGESLLTESDGSI